MHEKLKEVRISKGYSQDTFSKLIAMEQTTYSRKERGKSSVTEDEWNRFANALNVPKEEIKDEKPLTINNDNCSFKNSFFNTHYINVPETVLDVVIKYNQRLEEDNLFQKQEILKLNQELDLLKNTKQIL